MFLILELLSHFEVSFLLLATEEDIFKIFEILIFWNVVDHVEIFGVL